MAAVFAQSDRATNTLEIAAEEEKREREREPLTCATDLVVIPGLLLLVILLLLIAGFGIATMKKEIPASAGEHQPQKQGEQRHAIARLVLRLGEAGENGRVHAD